jgi:hypothetical protein
VESDFDFCARRAAEEFVAANRAETIEQRKHHRKLAEQYADLVRAMLFGRHREESPGAAARTTATIQRGRDAQAA